MAIITNNLTDTDYKVFEFVTNDPEGWVAGSIFNRLTEAKKLIIADLLVHCNANSIALAVGEDAQILQAFELEIVLTVDERNALNNP
tara:strand:- start:48 stop:308 length:261 start_codon:yes stop_codon:yes gene_type:complete